MGLREALVRRAEAGTAAGSELVVGPFRFDRASVKLHVNDVLMDLTLLEFKLLHLLAAAQGQVVDRDVIMREVWGYSDSARSRTLDTHIKRVREKLGDAERWIHTVRGYGYVLKKPEETASAS